MNFNVKKAGQIGLVSGLVLASMSVAGAAEWPDYYPQNYKALVDAATREGKVVVYASADRDRIQPLIDEFEKTFPGIKVEYNDMNSLTLYNRLTSESAAGGATADVSWTAAVDLHLKLVNEGIAEAYKSPEADKLAPNSVYNDSLYTVHYEPICHAYNKRLIDDAKLPKTTADIAKTFLDNKDTYTNKVGSYDIEKSGVGFFIAFTNARQNPDFWSTAETFGEIRAKFSPSASLVVEKVASGELAFAYHLPCSSLSRAAKNNPNLGIAFYSDSIPTLIESSVISKKAQNPNAAKVFTDFTLSQAGQKAFADMPGWLASRVGVTGSGIDLGVHKDALNLLKLRDEDAAAYVGSLEPELRVDFLRRWKSALEAGAAK